MTRNINKNVLALVFIGGLATTLLVTIFSKYLPLLLHRTIYFCQQLAQSMTFKMLPENMNLGIWFLILSLLLFVIVKLVVTALKTIAFSRKLQNTSKLPRRLMEIAQRHQLTKYLQVIQSNEPLAFCFGILNPRIYLSTGLLKTMNSQELEVILLHEDYHLKHRDNVIIVFANFLQSCLPFIPVLRDVVYRYRISRELAADIHAIVQLKNGKNNLVNILKKFLLYQPINTYALAPSIASIDTLEARIYSLIRDDHAPKKFSVTNIVISTISVMALSIFAVIPVYAVELHHDHSDLILACSDDAIHSLSLSSETGVEAQAVSPFSISH